MENPSRPGYEYLSAYILGKVIQDLTVQFCNRYISYKSRTHDQMVQAARSNSQNVAEGFSNPSLKGYIKLAGIAYGSNEELTKDYQDFLRQRNLPNDPTEAANMLLTFCNLEGFLLKRLVASLLEKHEKEGGLTEELYRKRTEYRRNH